MLSMLPIKKGPMEKMPNMEQIRAIKACFLRKQKIAPINAGIETIIMPKAR